MVWNGELIFLAIECIQYMYVCVSYRYNTVKCAKLKEFKYFTIPLPFILEGIQLEKLEFDTEDLEKV